MWCPSVAHATLQAGFSSTTLLGLGAVTIALAALPGNSAAALTVARDPKEAIVRRGSWRQAKVQSPNN